MLNLFETVIATVNVPDYKFWQVTSAQSDVLTTRQLPLVA